MSYGHLLGREISAARGRLQLTQTSTAVRMRALGFDWHQQTVASVERGTRRLTAEELLGVSYALETTIGQLAAPAVDGWVVLPNGGLIGTASVQRSAAGQRDDAIQWEDNEPVFTDPLLHQLVSEGAGSYSRATAAGRVTRLDPATGKWIPAEDGQQ